MTAVGLERLRVLVEGVDHSEAVAPDADGVLYSGGELGQLYRCDPVTGTAVEVARTGGFMLGMAFDADGMAWCCDSGKHELVRIDPRSGRIEVVSRGTAEHPMHNPNMASFDDEGRLYVTESGTWHGADGCIFRLERDGRTVVWSAESVEFPNGCCLTAAGDALLVAESTTPALVRIPVGADGAAGRREVIARLDGMVPDGVAVDEAGDAWVTCYRPDRIVRVQMDGTVDIVAEDPEGTLLAAPTNCTWIGPRRETFVCANLGRWHLTGGELGSRGLALRYPTL